MRERQTVPHNFSWLPVEFRPGVSVVQCQFFMLLFALQAA